MPQHANVSSIDDIKRFHAHLVTYVSKARGVLDEIHDEVLRTRLWLEGEQRTHWQGEVKRRALALDFAQQALLSAKLSGLRTSTGEEQFAVNRARTSLGVAEDKLARVRKWHQVYDGRVAVLQKGLSRLRNCLDTEMPKAIAYLAQTADFLDAYKAVAGAGVTAPRETTNAREGGGA